jgi:prepilin-type N-terminal cleavage/methylation domain-containing protein
MKKIKLAFTLIELIVVISIITLITSSWVFYFIDFVKKQEVEQKVSTLESRFNYYDYQVKNKQIYDYKINISAMNHSIWYQVDTNIFDNPTPQTITYNYDTHNAEVFRSWSGLIEIYKGIKLFHRSDFNAPSRTFILDNQNNYTISGSQWATILNNIDIYYYSAENYDSIIENNLELVEINTAIDGSWTVINTLEIQNINGQKALLGDGNAINQAVLIFEYAWQLSSIIITP